MVNMGVKMEIRVQVSHKYAGQLPPSHLFDCDSSDWLGSGENSFEDRFHASQTSTTLHCSYS